MGKIFNYDSKFFAGMTKVSDTIIINILFVICSIPIVTIGASITALYSVSMKITRDEDIYAAKEFIKQFKQNFKQSTIIWIILLVIGLFIGLDFYLCSLMSDNTISMIFKFIFTIVSVVLAFILIYVFPLTARFENSIKNTLTNSIFMSIQHLPYTLVMSVLAFAPILSFILFSQYLGQIVFFNTCISFGFIDYMNSILLNKIFSKYIQE